jgi:hypothetical protein
MTVLLSLSQDPGRGVIKDHLTLSLPIWTRIIPPACGLPPLEPMRFGRREGFRKGKKAMAGCGMGRRHTDEKGEEQLLVCFKGYARLSADIKRGAANIELVAQRLVGCGPRLSTR